MTIYVKLRRGAAPPIVFRIDDGPNLIDMDDVFQAANRIDDHHTDIDALRATDREWLVPLREALDIHDVFSMSEGDTVFGVTEWGEEEGVWHCDQQGWLRTETARLRDFLDGAFVVMVP